MHSKFTKILQNEVWIFSEMTMIWVTTDMGYDRFICGVLIRLNTQEWNGVPTLRQKPVCLFIQLPLWLNTVLTSLDSAGNEARSYTEDSIFLLRWSYYREMMKARALKAINEPIERWIHCLVDGKADGHPFLLSSIKLNISDIQLPRCNTAYRTD